jgi:hypothetical protein
MKERPYANNKSVTRLLGRERQQRGRNDTMWSGGKNTNLHECTYGQKMVKKTTGMEKEQKSTERSTEQCMVQI